MISGNQEHLQNELQTLSSSLQIQYPDTIDHLSSYDLFSDMSSPILSYMTEPCYAIKDVSIDHSKRLFELYILSGNGAAMQILSKIIKLKGEKMMHLDDKQSLFTYLSKDFVVKECIEEFGA